MKWMSSSLWNSWVKAVTGVHSVRWVVCHCPPSPGDHTKSERWHRRLRSPERRSNGSLKCKDCEAICKVVVPCFATDGCYSFVKQSCDMLWRSWLLGLEYELCARLKRSGQHNCHKEPTRFISLHQSISMIWNSFKEDPDKLTQSDVVAH